MSKLYIVSFIEAEENEETLLNVFTTENKANKNADANWKLLKKRNKQWMADFDYKPSKEEKQEADKMRMIELIAGSDTIAINVIEVENMDELRGFFKAKDWTYRLKDLELDESIMLSA